MSSEEPEDRSPEPDRVLAYQSPPAPDSSGGRREGTTALGCLITVIFIVGGVFLELLAGGIGAWSGPVAFSRAGLVLAAPVALGLSLRKSRRWGPLAAGLLIGVGVAALIEGICFASNWRS